MSIKSRLGQSIDISWYIHTMKCHEAVKMNVLQPYTMNLTNSVEQKMLDTKECLMYDSIYMKLKNKQNYLW